MNLGRTQLTCNSLFHNKTPRELPRLHFTGSNDSHTHPWTNQSLWGRDTSFPRTTGEAGHNPKRPRPQGPRVEEGRSPGRWRRPKKQHEWMLDPETSRRLLHKENRASQILWPRTYAIAEAPEIGNLKDRLDSVPLKRNHFCVVMNQKGKLSCQTVFGPYKASALGSFVFCIRCFSYWKIKTIASGYHLTYYWLKSLPEDLPSHFSAWCDLLFFLLPVTHD